MAYFRDSVAVGSYLRRVKARLTGSMSTERMQRERARAKPRAGEAHPATIPDRDADGMRPAGLRRMRTPLRGAALISVKVACRLRRPKSHAFCRIRSPRRTGE